MEDRKNLVLTKKKLEREKKKPWKFSMGAKVPESVRSAPQRSVGGEMVVALFANTSTFVPNARSQCLDLCVAHHAMHLCCSPRRCPRRAVNPVQIRWNSACICSVILEKMFFFDQTKPLLLSPSLLGWLVNPASLGYPTSVFLKLYFQTVNYSNQHKAPTNKICRRASSEQRPRTKSCHESECLV